MSNSLRARAAIACAVLVLHLGGLWALQHGLSTRIPAAEPTAPLMARLVEPAPPATPVAVSAPLPEPAPQVAAPKPPAQPREPQVSRPTPRPAIPQRPAVHAPEPPISIADPTPPRQAPAPTPLLSVPPATTAAAAPAESTNASAASNTGPRVPAVPSAAAPAVSTMAKEPPALQLPSSDAHYLKNPAPRYPPISLRLREQGTVLVDVLVSDQGLVADARVKTSSGFVRLDQAALSTVSTWQFVPGKRAGIAQSMWFTVPIVFRIQ